MAGVRGYGYIPRHRHIVSIPALAMEEASRVDWEASTLKCVAETTEKLLDRVVSIGHEEASEPRKQVLMI